MLIYEIKYEFQTDKTGDEWTEETICVSSNLDALQTLHAFIQHMIVSGTATVQTPQADLIDGPSGMTQVIGTGEETEAKVTVIKSKEIRQIARVNLNLIVDTNSTVPVPSFSDESESSYRPPSDIRGKLQ